MDALRFESDPGLTDPVLVVAFAGWNDAGDAATAALEVLRNRLGAERFAGIDPDPFYDFQLLRPTVHLVDGDTRGLDWPVNDFHGSRAGGHDLVLGVGVEPHLRWRDFCACHLEVARRSGARRVVSVGALLADVPHTRPVRLTGITSDAALAERLHLQRSGYEGPTGIVGVLHDAASRSGLETVSLWAAVPHYVSATPNPQAALALVEAVADLAGLTLELDELRGDAERFCEGVNEAMRENDEVVDYVKDLERRYDAGEALAPGHLPTGEELAAELEDFLASRREGDPGEES